MSDNGNSNSHPPQEEHRPETAVESLGSILATARNRHGLTIEQVAAELRVESPYLEALEEDRLEVFAAPVFVKGYLRHLANRFGLEYDSLLQRYVEQTDASDAPVTYSEPIRETNTLLVPLIIGALILVLGIPAFWFTWVSRDSLSDVISSDGEPPLPAETQTLPEETAGSPDPGIIADPFAPPRIGAPDFGQTSSPDVDPEDAPMAVPGPNPGAAVPAEGELPAGGVPPAEGVAPADSGAPVEPNQANPALPEDQPPTGEDPAEVSPPENADAPPPGAASVAEPPVPSPSPDALISVAIRFLEDSWAEVSDGNGNSLYYALGMAGTTANLDGVPPLSFMLGNPLGVEVSINDQPFTVPPPQGNDTTSQFVVSDAP